MQFWFHWKLVEKIHISISLISFFLFGINVAITRTMMTNNHYWPKHQVDLGFLSFCSMNFLYGFTLSYMTPFVISISADHGFLWELWWLRRVLFKHMERCLVITSYLIFLTLYWKMVCLDKFQKDQLIWNHIKQWYTESVSTYSHCL